MISKLHISLQDFLTSAWTAKQWSGRFNFLFPSITNLNPSLNQTLQI
jgi:hypothetical protein